MSIHRLQPDAAAVVNVPGLVDMIHAIEAYVTPRNGNNSSQHAADVYLAMALGFEQAGVAMVSDFPSLRVSDGSNRVEVCLLMSRFFFLPLLKYSLDYIEERPSLRR